MTSSLKKAQEPFGSKFSVDQRTNSWPSTVKFSHSEDDLIQHINAVYEDEHPRKGINEWKWKGTIAVICLTNLISGYDVSNVANIQPRLYEALGHIELLEWISLSYSLAIFSVLSLARKIVYCFDLRWIHLSHLVVFTIGSAVAGMAPNISTVIVGRSIMGIGGAVILQTNLSYLAVFATAAETPGVVAASSAAWAIGLAIGGPIGSAFAENLNWRWAFYLNIPLIAAAFILSAFCVPHHTFYRGTSLMQRLKSMDPVGVALNAAVPELFAIAVTFANPIWDWGSGASVAVWFLFAICLVLWIVQQYFCIFTTKEERALPIHILSRLDLLPIWIASACAGSVYAVTLIYTPLFFAFARGANALQQSVRMLPFTLLFIITLMLTGRLLPIVRRYKMIYIAAGIVSLAASISMAATLSKRTTSEAQVMGLEAILGIGLGLHFQHGVGISNVINKRQRDRVDSVVFCNIAQFGGIAITLAIAGSVFQNVGYRLLADAVDHTGLSEHDIREALAGVSSTLWQTPTMVEQVTAAVSEVISKEFYLAVSAGALCLLCGIFMRSEKLDYEKKEEDMESTPIPM